MLGLTKQSYQQPFALVIYGVEGIGKTTVGFDSPEPIFVGSEKGTANLVVWRFPAPKTWQEFVAQIKRLITDPHDRQTLVIDSLDWLEDLAFNEVVRTWGKAGATIDTAHGGFDRGKIQSTRLWKALIELLDELRDKRKMNIICIAHADAKNFKDPILQDDYMRYSIKLFKTTSALFKEWCDALIFANYGVQQDKDGRVFGGGRKRHMYSNHHHGFDAKNRFGMPDRFDDVKFSLLYKFIKGEPVDEILERIEKLAPLLPEERQDGLRKAIGDCGKDRKKLLEVERFLISEVQKINKDNEI